MGNFTFTLFYTKPTDSFKDCKKLIYCSITIGLTLQVPTNDIYPRKIIPEQQFTYVRYEAFTCVVMRSAIL
jgi:hypothetical protein